MKPIVTVVHKASPTGRVHVPDMVIKTDGVWPDVRDLEDGWEKRIIVKHEAEGRAIAEAMWRSLSGGTVDQVLLALMERRASLLRVRF
jgi:hypothetical protein